MFRILKYSFYDLIRSKWTLFYCLFYAVLTLSLFALSTDVSKVIITLLNIILVLVPLIAIIFGVLSYYNSREFVELLLAQPIKRTSIFIGQYLGVSLSLSLSLLLGVGVPFLFYGIFASTEILNYFTLLIMGVVLSMIFSGIGFLIALKFQNKIKGFSIAIFTWLFLAVIYDGIFLLLLAAFSDYPLETFALSASMFNPIDLSRILLLLKLDISALMGYTGAVFQKFLGSYSGILLAAGILMLWVMAPVLGIRRLALRKDF